MFLSLSFLLLLKILLMCKLPWIYCTASMSNLGPGGCMPPLFGPVLAFEFDMLLYSEGEGWDGAGMRHEGTWLEVGVGGCWDFTT